MTERMMGMLRAGLEGLCANVVLPAWLALILLRNLAREAMRHDGD